MKYASLFSGIEAATVAWEPLGWEPLCFAEIDPFPSAVLAERFPSVPNLGDVTKVNWRSFVRKCGRPDLVVGGSPCQSFSIAGTRTGLEGASGLMWEYVRAVREVRPEWVIWENVPGALSSSHGEDFRCLLESLDALGYGMAWRVLDAQFFGVAQRRERVFLVGRLGSRPPVDVLFEPEGVRWDPKTSREKRKELAAAAGRGAACAGSKYSAGSAANGIGYEEESSNTLTADWHAPAVIPINEQVATRSRSLGRGTGLGVGSDGDPAFTLPANHPHCVASEPYAVRMREGRAGGGKGPLVQEGVSGTIATGNDQTIFSFAQGSHDDARDQGDVVGTIGTTASQAVCLSDDTSNAAVDEECCGTLKCGGAVPSVTRHMVVRRLMPVECERLQGFPGEWTRIPWKGRPADECPDGPRYKAIGNSMAVPVMRWIGERIGMVDASEHEETNLRDETEACQ